MLMSPSEVAEFAVTSGALNSANLTNIIFDRLEEGDAFQNTDVFFWTLIQSEVKIISLKSYLDRTSLILLIKLIAV